MPPDQQEQLLSDSLARAGPRRHARPLRALLCARRAGSEIRRFLVKLWSIRDAVDRTLELAPDFPDALLGKGAFLCSVPRLLGGDCAEGERLVRRALEVDPDYVGARLFLAKTLLEDGRTTDARLEGEWALASAERKRDAAAVDDARRVLSSIDG